MHVHTHACENSREHTCWCVCVRGNLPAPLEVAGVGVQARFHVSVETAGLSVAFCANVTSLLSRGITAHLEEVSMAAAPLLTWLREGPG